MRSDDVDNHLELLTSRAQQGDPQAFSALVNETTAVAYRVALRTVGDPSDAEDVVQEAYIRAWRSLAKLRDPGAVVGWICGIVRHVGLDRLRQRKRRRAEPYDETKAAQVAESLLAGRVPDPAHAAESAEDSALLESLVAEIKEKYRVVLLLREVDGMSYEEIAEAMSIPVGTVESRLHRARKQLAKKLKHVLRAQEKEAA